MRTLVALFIIFSISIFIMLGTYASKTYKLSLVDNPYKLSVVRNPSSKCVVSVAIQKQGSKFKKKLGLLIKNKKLFCRKSGYTCYIFQNVIIQEDRPLAWQKIHAIEKVLNTSCQHILYVDADTVFMKKFSFPQYNTSIAVVSDSNGPNTGVMFIKNTHWTKSFFDIIKKLIASIFIIGGSKRLYMKSTTRHGYVITLHC